ncbi:hypothetical protein HY448_02640 [Candidatus Pacearchaeota archaeon]|nr:hypothetical protein [Candidatus Pacearchaeota archaeon]
MGWKEWPYWLKGGILGTIIYLFFIMIAYFLGKVAPDIGYMLSVIFFLYDEFISYLTSPIFKLFDFIPYIGYLLFGIKILGLPFIIGALIGWIYGKIKS